MASRSIPLYTTDILRLAASLQEMRELDHEDGRVELRSPTCGSRITMTVQLDGDRRVQMISQQVNACAFGQASAALVQQHGIGRGHDEIANALVKVSRWLAEEDSASDWPGLEVLAPARPRKGRHGAILLPFRALLAAIEAAAK
jgi:NifU-like protein involved in Fe-S cluster formation